MDARGDDFAVGAPMITHLKEGNALRNTWQKHLCHLVNDEFIGILTDIPMPASTDVSYLELVARASEHFGMAKASPLLQAYLRHLARCMDAWVKALS